MREKPTLRIPLGLIALLIALGIYIFAVASLSPWVGQWHAGLQAVFYLVAGVAWLLPLRRFLIWMETGRWG
ncbi:MAG: hypothetical protein B7Z08_06430 [Sphingomonadales bacterium 32-68-7]|nr:MAG: hypothetical protein B7Z33_12280 [Sphingomonadales bacterium 12-68-11]OYX09164.1 MAG: hypothetical protein B7Z08_06430 [Sphingomonadales bacterium 32-68-7]